VKTSCKLPCLTRKGENVSSQVEHEKINHGLQILSIHFDDHGHPQLNTMGSIGGSFDEFTDRETFEV
jgi:hypothetical protein